MYRIENETVVFNDNFNEKLSGHMIKYIDKYGKVKFGKNFNQNVDDLPNSLVRVEFGSNFNQKIDKLLDNLTHLNLSESFLFNYKVEHLPSCCSYILINFNDFGRLKKFVLKLSLR